MVMLIQTRKVRVRKTPTRGKGVFATKRLTEGTIVADYIGQVYDLRSRLPRYPGLYDMWVYKNLTICPDISKTGAHLINHSCEPNCVMYPYKGHILIVTARDIKPGEELTFHYWCSEDSETIRCQCGSEHCRGSWHVSTKKCLQYCRWVEDKVEGFYGKQKRIGEVLKPFSNYPKRTSQRGLQAARLMQTI